MATAGERVSDLLAELGVDYVFGVVGSSAMEIYDGLHTHPRVRYIGARDERAATGMADGYARASGSLGVVLAGQSGPGVTNLVSGLAAAKAAHTPILSLGGSVSTDQWHNDAFQEVDQEALIRPVAKAVLTVLKPERVIPMIEYAARLAMSHPMGPVHVNLPRDVLMGQAPEVQLGGSLKPSNPSHPEAIEHVLRLIGSAERPVIVAGGGVKSSRSGELVERLSDILRIPVVTSAGHRDAVNNEHPLMLGQMGPRGGALAAAVVAEADLVIGVGTRFGFNSTFFEPETFRKDARLVQVDVDSASLNRYWPVELAVMAEAGSFLAELLSRVDEGAVSGTDAVWFESVKERAAQYREERASLPDTSHKSPLDDATLFHTLRQSLPRESIISLDAGTWCLKASEALDHALTPSLFTPLDFASLGFAFPAAIGAQLACPERPSVALLGDGGALYAIAELSTVIEHDIPVTMIVMNNSAWGAEKAYQHDFYEKRYIGTDLPSHDFASIAESFGIRGLRADSAQSLELAIKEAFADQRPTVIDVRIDPEILFSFRKDVFRKFK
ncbi:thiamine pyrophosphate-binding protein [Paeniglutamicibacter kerguelensis]|uniref:Acetolactate synthase-1/2/3 large subunit/sulfoacetaldehyde acetyltransferase n=1 Tax=Paeniglutamicibacter kerguelensis TaxID=254788 RepID=A0ABS4X838_9MICC|nr:acetolactate synthase-1/2/3 large subunit/sulfoacetaldehyde acetyltransferase [Paeniglutamicibacter kerguelensis]